MLDIELNSVIPFMAQIIHVPTVSVEIDSKPLELPVRTAAHLISQDEGRSRLRQV